LNRQDVYRALASERKFQDEQTDLSMGDLLIAMEVNLRKAQAAWYRDAAPYRATMDFVRKVGGLAVKAGEQFGIPSRE
jgi:hypothetical protein